MPDIPDSFWQLSGVSALAYVGGKLVRLPGPVIQQVCTGFDWAGVLPAKIELEVIGTGLTPEATFTLTSGAAKINFIGVDTIDPGGEKRAIMTDGEKLSATVSRLRLSFDRTRDGNDFALIFGKSPMPNDLKLEIRNPDGQTTIRPIN